MTPKDKIAYSVAEAVEACSVSIDTIRRAIRAGNLPAHAPITGKYLLLAEHLRGTRST